MNQPRDKGVSGASEAVDPMVGGGGWLAKRARVSPSHIYKHLTVLFGFN